MNCEDINAISDSHYFVSWKDKSTWCFSYTVDNGTILDKKK